MLDEYSEELSFPKLFPTGKFGFQVKRDVTLSCKKYFNARILHHSGKFASDLDYVFYAQYICEYKSIMDSITVAMRKSYTSSDTDTLCSGLVQDKEKMKNLIMKDHAFQFLKSVRGSPPYWQNMMYKLLAAVKQFGIFTFFITLSSADLQWPDMILSILSQKGISKTKSEVEEMSYDEKCSILKSNPVTAARHFDHKLSCFIKDIINSNMKPIGQIEHYSYRVEFQKRGSPHAHMLFWVKDAPKFSESNTEEICEYIDQYITCHLPPEEVNKELHDLVKRVQKHNHTRTCKKKDKTCRFRYPRLPSHQTVIAKKPPQGIF